MVADGPPLVLRVYGQLRTDVQLLNPAAGELRSFCSAVAVRKKIRWR